MATPEAPMSLLIHDGELSDVCALLGNLGLDFRERRGSATPDDEARGWDLVISSPKRLMEFDPGPSGCSPTRIAVLDKDSKTLRAMLHRAGVDVMVRRPVHPAALRLLVLHSLYRGPEKRRSLRVSVGAHVRFRTGLRRRAGLLADLSSSGCRLITAHPVERGHNITLQIPAAVAGGRGFSITGKVVRAAQSEADGIHTLAVSFGRPKPRLAERVRAAVSAHSTGPATLSAEDESVLANTPQVRTAEVVEAPTAPEPAAEAAAPEAATPRIETERRASPRHAYDRRVIALGEAASRVLLGRDISLGGMRVEAHPDIGLGDELQIALHLRAREHPLVVRAAVSRDDGADGLVLQFRDLSEEAGVYLQRMVNYLPILSMRDGEEEGRGVIVSEILDHWPSGAAPMPGNGAPAADPL